MSTTTRQRADFTSNGTRCAAWFYPGRNGACIVMAGGAGVPKEPATDRFAARFQDAGFAVLAFDYRRLGASDGTPRQVLRVRDQLDDLRAAITHAQALPGVEPGRVGGWGFSSSAGHLLRLLAGHASGLGAVIAQTPYVGGRKASAAALAHQTAAATSALMALAVRDAVAGVFGRRPHLVPLAGPKGTVAMLTTPDAQQGGQALDADGHPEWVQAIAARSVLSMAAYRPGKDVGRIERPVLYVVCDDDIATLASATLEAAFRTPGAQNARFPGGHYAPFLEAHDAVVEAEIDFLTRTLCP
jgi:pimeloyl-ACP methyl ester carboxylesterase